MSWLSRKECARFTEPQSFNRIWSYTIATALAYIHMVTCTIQNIPEHSKMNALKCRTLGAKCVRILKSARATEMRVMESIQKIVSKRRRLKRKKLAALH